MCRATYDEEEDSKDADVVVMEELLRQRVHLENERRASSKTATLAAKTASAQQQRLRAENTELLEAGYTSSTRSFVHLSDNRPISRGRSTEGEETRQAHGG